MQEAVQKRSEIQRASRRKVVLIDECNRVRAGDLCSARCVSAFSELFLTAANCYSGFAGGRRLAALHPRFHPTGATARRG